MKLKIRRAHELGGIIFLLGYDVMKYLLFGDLMMSQGIDAHIFLFLDMVTVPGFVIGSARLVSSFSGQVPAWTGVAGWGLVVLFSTLLPYAYAASAGKAHFTGPGWAVLGGLVILILANMIRTICVRVREKKTGRIWVGCDHRKNHSDCSMQDP